MKYQGINPFDKLHDGEPWFFLRAQDKHSLPMLRVYASLLSNDGDKHGCKSIFNLIEEFEEWQKLHPDKIKTPD